MDKREKDALTVANQIADITHGSQCYPDLRDGGIFCHNRETNKIYQATTEGTSVAKMYMDPPESYDFERNGILIKQINEKCQLSTSNGIIEGKPIETTLLLCYKDNVDPNRLDIGDNMVEMNNALDEALSKI